MEDSEILWEVWLLSGLLRLGLCITMSQNIHTLLTSDVLLFALDRVTYKKLAYSVMDTPYADVIVVGIKENKSKTRRETRYPQKARFQSCCPYQKSNFPLSGRDLTGKLFSTYSPRLFSMEIRECSKP
jgi:hypothetical protein